MDNQDNPTPAVDAQTPAEQPAVAQPTADQTVNDAPQAPEASNNDSTDSVVASESENAAAAPQAAPAVDPSTAPLSEQGNTQVVVQDAPADPQVDLSATTDTTAGNVDPATVPPVALAPQPQTPEVQQANAGPTPPGVLIKQKTVDELNSELDNVHPQELEDWIFNHWQARDANIAIMARVLREDETFIREVLKDRGVQFPNGA